MTPDSKELEIIYRQRFAGRQEYRNRVWQVLIRDVFGEFVRPEDTVIDLGCGYGEFINQVGCATRYGMDANPASIRMLASGSCSTTVRRLGLCPPLFFLRLNLAMPLVWPLFGKQFLVVGVRRENKNKVANAC
jgi:hypothetical protein